MSQITVIKAKLLKGDKVEIEYLKRDKHDDAASECSEASSIPPRKEFAEAISKLTAHFILCCEFMPLKAIKDIKNPDPELLEKYHVSGFSISKPGTGDEGVILTGQKTLRSGKKVGINTPVIRFSDESPEAYEHLEILEADIRRCEDESRKYLNGEHAPNPQQKLDLK